MRKLIIANIVSLDGFYEGPGGNVMALPMDHGFVADDPAAAARQLGIPVEYLDTPANREISRLENAIDKLVVSDSLTTDQTDPWQDSTRIVRRADAHERIAELKRASGGDILVFGSRTLWNDLLAAGLVDELHLIVGAVVLGGGTPAFATPPPARLRLLDVRTFDGSDNVLVRYAAWASRSHATGATRSSSRELR